MSTLIIREARNPDYEQFAELKWRHYDGHYQFSADKLRANPAERYVVARGAQVLAAAEPKAMDGFPDATRPDIFGEDADAWALLASRGAEVLSPRTQSLVSVVRQDHASNPRLPAAGYRLSWQSWAAHLHLDGALPADAFAETTAGPVAEGFTVGELTEQEVPKAYELYVSCRSELPVTPATPSRDLDAQQFADALSDEPVFAVLHEGRCVAMTEVGFDGDAAESEFTAVAPDMRGRGLATLVKATAVSRLSGEGVREFGTGGGCPADAIMHVDRKLGYETELWNAYELVLAPAGAR